MISHALQSMSEFTMGLSTNEEAPEHFKQAAGNFLHAAAYLLMMIMTPFVSVIRPVARLISTCNDETPATLKSS